MEEIKVNSQERRSSMDNGMETEEGKYDEPYAWQVKFWLKSTNMIEDFMDQKK